MEWEKFVQKSSEKFKSTGNKDLDLLYCSIGISTEIADMIGAFVQANDKLIHKKIGMVSRHIANLESVIGRDIVDLPAGATQTLFMDEWLIGHQELVKQCKENFFHDSKRDLDFIHQHCEQCKAIVKGMCFSNKIPLSDILKENIQSNGKI